MFSRRHSHNPSSNISDSLSQMLLSDDDSVYDVSGPLNLMAMDRMCGSLTETAD